MMVGGVPFQIDVGGSAELSSTLQTNTSAIIIGETSFKGGEYGTAGNVPVITGNCTTWKVNFGATAGQSVSFLGLSFGQEKKSGDACE